MPKLDIRNPKFADNYYPHEKKMLQVTIDGMLKKTSMPAQAPRAVITPHAAYRFCGHIIAKALMGIQAQKGSIKRVVILCPCHRRPLEGFAVPKYQEFATPLGNLGVEHKIIGDLVEKFDGLHFDDEIHDNEFGIEVLLPFIQRLLGDVKIVPLIFGKIELVEIQEIIEYLWKDQATLLVVSSDLSHYLPYSEAQQKDVETANAIESLETDKITDDHACGSLAFNAMINVARLHGLKPIKVAQANSADMNEQKDAVVGYGAFHFYSCPPHVSVEQKRKLRQFAKESILYGLKHKKPMVIPASNHEQIFDRPAASFVTLNIKPNNDLRGCIGSLLARRNMLEDVVVNAYNAAFNDPRFPPLNEGEFASINLEISLLSHPEVMIVKDEVDLLAKVRPNLDGLILIETKRNLRSTFLPSVWEQLPEAEQFVRRLKMKAGLPAHYWSKDIQIFRYTTLKF